MHTATLSLPLIILIVFGAAKLFSETFEHLGQPGIVGEILAGALVGPSVLGWVTPSDTLKALADLGVLFLLFGVGLEVKAPELVRVGGTATLVAILGELAAFLAGWGILRAWGMAGHEATFAGVALVATSVGVTATVLSARNLLQEVASRIILAAAVIDDVLGLIVLGAAVSIARGRANFATIVLMAALATAFTLVLALWGTKAVGRLLPHFQSRARAEEAHFHLSMVLLFALAVLALSTGVAAIVGAFLAGMALSDSVDRRVRDLTRGVSELLVPFFLVGIGLHFDFTIFRSRSAILLALALLAAAIATKLAGCGAGVLPLGWQNALRVGFGMAPRGEVAMVAAQMGLTLAVFSTNVYSVIVFVVVASTLLTPLLLKFAFRPPMPSLPKPPAAKHTLRIASMQR
jgi:Kef-type K+ transport system membrane component KefB